MAEITKLQAIAGAKCPHCRKGDMFMYPISKVSKFMEMHKRCQVCGMRFEVEPGFFYGSMYFTYIMTVAIVIVVGFATHIIGNEPHIAFYLVNIFLTTIFLTPFSFRYARVLMLHLFGGVSYDSSFHEVK